MAQQPPQQPRTTAPCLMRTSPWAKDAFAIMHQYHEVWDAKHHGKFPGPKSGTPGRQEMDDWMKTQHDNGRLFNWDSVKSLYRHYKIQRTTILAPDATVQGSTVTPGVGVVQDDYLPRLAARVNKIARSVAVAAVAALMLHAICTCGQGFKLFLFVVQQNEEGLREVVEDWVRGQFHSTMVTNRPDNASKYHAKDRAVQAYNTVNATAAALDWSGNGDGGVPAPAAAITAEFVARASAYPFLVARAAQTVCHALHLLAFNVFCEQLSGCDLPPLPATPGPADGIDGAYYGGSPYPLSSANAAAVYYVAGWLAVMLKNAVFCRRGESQPRATARLESRDRVSDHVQRQVRFMQCWVMEQYESDPNKGKVRADADRLPTSNVDLRNSTTGQANYTSLLFYILISYLEKCFALRIRAALARGDVGTNFLSTTASEIADSCGAHVLLARTFRGAGLPTAPTGASNLLMENLMHNYVRMRGKDFVKAILVNSARNANQSAGFRAKISVKHAAAGKGTKEKAEAPEKPVEVNFDDNDLVSVDELDASATEELQRLVDAGAFDD